VGTHYELSTKTVTLFQSKFKNFKGFQINLFVMHANLITYINRPLEAHELLLQQLFPKNSPLLIMDIGACEGDSTVRYAQQFPQATLYTFEPLPNNMQTIKSMLSHFGVQTPIKLFGLALSNQNGTADFYRSSGNPENIENVEWDFGNKSSSLLPPDKITSTHQWMKFEEVVTVQTQTLLDFCKEQQISAIDFIHIDVQGAELLVLQGAGEQLNHLKAIWLEAANVTYYKDQATQNEIGAFMKAKGFVKLLDTIYDRADGDQFWVQPRLFDQEKQPLLQKLVQQQQQDEQNYYAQRKKEQRNTQWQQLLSPLRRWLKKLF
jgi:FkbM family methyltransferase